MNTSEEIIDISLIDNIEDISVDCTVKGSSAEMAIVEDSVQKVDLLDCIITTKEPEETHSVITVNQEDTTDIETALENVDTSTVKEGDLLVVAGSDGGTLYSYSEEYGWINFSSGEVDAEHILLKEDIICAGDYTQVGNVEKTKSGTTTIPAKGKTLASLIKTVFTKELQPSKTEPSTNLSFPQAGSYEVGTSITPSYSTSLNIGSYTYGPATGVSATGYSVKDSAGNSSTKSADTFSSFVVEDNTNYSITSTIAHSEGVIAYTNLGADSDPAIQISAGTKSRTSGSVTGFRAMFYGVIDNTNELDSSSVRLLTNGGKASSKTITIKVNGDTNAKRICVILPTKSNLKITKVMKTDGLATDITATYSKTGTVQVDGKDNHNLLADYSIWTYQPAKIDSAEVHQITIG